MGCHFLLQGTFPTQGWNSHPLCLLHSQADSLPLSHLERPLKVFRSLLKHLSLESDEAFAFKAISSLWFSFWVGKIPWRRDKLPTPVFLGFPAGSVGKESACSAGDPGSIPGSGRSSREGISYPLQYSWISLVAQLVKNLPAMWDIWVQSLGRWEDPLEK